MTDRVTSLKSRVPQLARRYRVHLGTAAGILVLYALAGFFLAPWLLKKNAEQAVRETFGAELRLGKVAINPFVLSLRIDDLELDDPDAQPVARVGQVYVNFQSSSLFRWAWTFDEFRVDAPQLFLERDEQGEMNVAFFADRPSAEEAQAEASADEAAATPRLLVFDFAINESVLDWRDEMPAEDVASRFGPVNIRILELNTLPQRSGQQTVVITTEDSGTLSWSGDLQLNPLHSAGHAEIEGSHFALPSDYLRQQTGFDVVDGLSHVSLDYEVFLDADGVLQADVSNFDLAFDGVVVRKSDPGGDGAAPGEEREVLDMPAFRIGGGSFAWPERRVAIGSIEIDDTVVSIHRDAAGRINWLPGDPGESRPDAEPPEPQSAPSGQARPWTVTLDRLAVRRMAVGVEDHGVAPHAEIGLAALDLTVTDVSNAEGAAFPTTATMSTQGGGTINLEGTLSVLPAPVVDFDVSVADAALALMHPYIRPLADVSLDSGVLNLDGHLRSSPDDALAFEGDFNIAGFLVTETDQGSRLGSWDRLGFDNVTISAARRAFEVAEVRFDKPYADIYIAEDGSVNLGRVGKGDAQAAGDESGAGAAADDAQDAPADEGGGASVTIGRVVISDGAADFVDDSLPLPFAAKIAALEGDMSTIASGSVEPSSVALEGKVDEYGFVQVTGSVTPLDPKLNTDIKVRFQNVEMPKFSAYTVPFAGREIASGKLDLDLGYAVKASELVGENRIVLRDFELGDKVEHPGAMSLPLGLAVALLKDPSGKIDIDLPVRGNVDDPEFGYGRVVLKALANLIIKIVASPFALLGNLVGVEADELSHIEFLHGRADLTPPELERIAKLAEALALRPELIVEIDGVVDREADGHALRAMKLDALLEERLAAVTPEDADVARINQVRREVLEELYSASGSAADPDVALDELRIRHTTIVTDEESGRERDSFDAVAYSAELRRVLIDLQPLDDSELAALANQRAANTRDAIATTDPALADRVVIGRPTAVDGKDDEPVRMDVKLTVGEAVAAETGAA